MLVVKVFGTTANISKPLLRKMGKSFGFGRTNIFSTKTCKYGETLRKDEKLSVARSKNVTVLVSGYVLEINESPAKHLLKVFENKGVNEIVNCNGCFCAVIHNSATKSTFLVTDRFGMTPIYYTKHKEELYFGSEIKAILSAGVPNAINWEGMADFVTYGHPLNEGTLFKDIKCMPGGSVLTFHDGVIRIRKVWKYSDIPVIEGRTTEELVNQGIEKITRAVQKTVSGIKSCDIPLSGGYDSRTITATAKMHTKVKFDTYTITKILKSTDAKYGTAVAKALKVPNHLIESDPFYALKNIEQIMFELEGQAYEHGWFEPLAKKIKRSIILDGLAGDWILQSAHDERHLNLYKDERNLPMLLQEGFLTAGSYGAPDPEKLAVCFKGAPIPLVQTSKRFHVMINKSLGPDPLTAMALLNRTHIMISLAPENIFSRHTSPRFPFLEYEFVDWAMGVPPEQKVRERLYHKIIQKAFPMLRKVPTTNDITESNIRARKIQRLIYVSKVHHLLKRRREAIVEASKGSILSPEYKPCVDKLMSLIEKTPFPVFLDKETALKFGRDQISIGRNPCHVLIPLIHIAVWYNIFKPKI